MFTKHTTQAKVEGDSLAVLAEHVRVPKVYEVTNTTIKMEKIIPATSTANSDILLASDLIKLHRVTNDKFGWNTDNFIGENDQKNDWREDWSDFFIEMRLEFQLSQPTCSSILSLWDQAKESIIEELKQVNEPPSLTHGDLWAGNVLIDSKTDSPVFIDPAISFSHRETDLAMMKLFGGFSSRVFEEYNKQWPLLPRHKERNSIYQLYHILNHANIFGVSYLSQAKQIMNKFT